jgi:YVTN family beta-propeller protein
MTNSHSKNFATIATAASAGRITVSRRVAVLVLAATTAMALAMSFTPPASAEPAASGLVYSADEYGNTVSRIDLGSGKVDILPVRITPHNVQFVPGKNLLLAVGLPVPENRKGSHGEQEKGHGGEGHGGSAAPGQLIILETADMALGAKISIAVGGHPAHVIADAEGRRAYVSNSADDTLSVIDLQTGKVIATASTGDYPHGLRMSPDGRSIYVANVQDGTVSVIDAASLSEVARIKVGSAPVQVGFTPDGRRVYVSLRDENKVAVIDTTARQVIARIEVGRSPIQVHTTPDGRFVYVANQGTETEPDNTVSVIDTESGKVVKTIQTGKGAHGVTISRDGAFVFVTNIVEGTISEISVASQSVVRTYKVGKGPNGITYQAR